MQKIVQLTSKENSFDLLRMVAAAAVLYSHSFSLVGLKEPEPIAGQTYGSLAVAAFFAISGFLVSQSWMRDPSILRFVTRRAARIVPGLLVVVLCTAFLLGPLMSSLAPADYFSHMGAWEYALSASLLLNVPNLPGVFELNPFPNSTNGSLWTLRYEVLMYGSLAASGFLFPRKRLHLTCVALAAIFASGFLVLLWAGLAPYKVPLLWKLSTELYLDRICYLGAFFFVGCLFHFFHSKIPLSPILAVVLIGAATSISNRYLLWPLLWIAIPYAALTFAFRAPALLRRVNGHDYSYGIYIYSFPVQQVVAQMMRDPADHWMACLLVSGTATFILAILSWRFVERPGLLLKDAFNGGRARPHHAIGTPTAMM